jgi:hypothetical protein
MLEYPNRGWLPNQDKLEIMSRKVIILYFLQS